MDNNVKKWKHLRNIVKLAQYREINTQIGRLLQEKSQFSDVTIKRLSLETELEGHQGCVNCLQWSPNGLHLASGSDDTNVILWDPFRHKRIHTIPTPHIGNIFSVKFLTDANLIATAAGDCRVIVQSIDGALQENPPLLDCVCHVGRVKRLAICPDQPAIFWSAGEDGLVIQYDMREPHECPEQSKILIDWSFKSEMKCIAVNPTRSHYIAIGANDCFVRLYDRRMIKLTNHRQAHLLCDPPDVVPKQPENLDCVQYYAPGHLAKENASIYSLKLAVTYIAFNTAGTEMLVNIGGEQIYLYDVNNSRHINQLRIPHCLPKRFTLPYKNCCGDKNDNIINNEQLDCPCFYIKRATKSYQRRWMSDLYGAARDYLHVMQYWPDYKPAYIGLIKCLLALDWYEEANDWFQYFLKLYPNEMNPQIKMLCDQLQKSSPTKLKDNDDSISSSTTSTNNNNNNNHHHGCVSIGNMGGLKRVEDDERKLRLNSNDYEKRYLGHCNTTTDIKEANFLGNGDQYICAGSDEGLIFIWEKNSMEIVRAMYGDNSIVNCIQPHPSACVLASSGIDTAVKIWSPRPEDGKQDTLNVDSIAQVIETNQHRMCMDPFEAVPTCRTS